MRFLIFGAAIAASLSFLAGIANNGARASVTVSIDGRAYEPSPKPYRVGLTGAHLTESRL